MLIYILIPTPSPHRPCCALTVIVFLQTCIIGFLPSHSCAKKDIGDRGQHDYCSTVSPRCDIREAVNASARADIVFRTRLYERKAGIETVTFSVEGLVTPPSVQIFITLFPGRAGAIGIVSRTFTFDFPLRQ